MSYPQSPQKNSADQLKCEIQQLRTSLQTINSALIEAQNAKVLPKADVTELKIIPEVHPASVAIMEKSVVIQNGDLQLEINNIDRNLKSLIKDNLAHKSEIAKLTSEISQLSEKDKVDKANSDALLEERQEANTQFNQLQQECSQWRLKVQSLEQLLQFTLKQNEKKRHDIYKQTTQLEAELEALNRLTGPLTERLASLEKGDVDKAKDEVRKASKTIDELSETVKSLSQKLKDQQKSNKDQTVAMQASIVALDSPSRKMSGTNENTVVIKSQLEALKQTNQQLQSRLNEISNSQVQESQVATQSNVNPPYKIGQLNSSNLQACVAK